MRTTENARAAGWYDDEQDAAAQRYWDGASWTPHTVPQGGAEAPHPAATAGPDVDEVTLTFSRGVSTLRAFARDPAGATNEHTTVPLPSKDTAAASAPHLVSGDQAYAPAGRSFVLIWLFALFLGSLGVDRFALGRPATAVAKLLTAGGLGVWSLVDLVLVLTGVQRDGDGNPLDGSDAHRRVAWVVSAAVVLLGVCSGIATSLIVADLATTLGATLGGGSPDGVVGLP